MKLILICLLSCLVVFSNCQLVVRIPNPDRNEQQDPFSRIFARLGLNQLRGNNPFNVGNPIIIRDNSNSEDDSSKENESNPQNSPRNDQTNPFYGLPFQGNPASNGPNTIRIIAIDPSLLNSLQNLNPSNQPPPVPNQNNPDPNNKPGNQPNSNNKPSPNNPPYPVLTLPDGRKIPILDPNLLNSLISPTFNQPSPLFNQPPFGQPPFNQPTSPQNQPLIRQPSSTTPTPTTVTTPTTTSATENNTDNTDSDDEVKDPTTENKIENATTPSIEPSNPLKPKSGPKKANNKPISQEPIKQPNPIDPSKDQNNQDNSPEVGEPRKPNASSSPPKNPKRASLCETSEDK